MKCRPREQINTMLTMDLGYLYLYLNPKQIWEVTTLTNPKENVVIYREKEIKIEIPKEKFDLCFEVISEG